MNDADLPEVLRTVKAQVAQCQAAPAAEGKKAFGEAMTRLVRARNARLRKGDDSKLRQLNAVLSMMASIEFPMDGFHRERIGLVTKALDGIG